MNTIFDITDEKTIKELFDSAEYGTLAICADNRPYSLPINFVEIDDNIYFHGSKKGRKIDILKNNSFASFSIVESYSMIQSYFSSNDDLACSATQFFKSVIIDGKIEFVEEYSEKALAMSRLMQKLQKEGKYRPFSDDAYKGSINATQIYKLIPSETRAKFKFGQNLTQERFDMIIEHLEKRGTQIDRATTDMMKKLRKQE